MRLGILNRLRNGYGNIYTPHAGSMIIQVQRENGLANRTIVISERHIALLRIVGSRIGVAVAAVFFGTWLLFAVQSVRIPVLSDRIAELERDNRRIDSLQVALSRMHGRYEQVRQMLAVSGVASVNPESSVTDKGTPPNAKSTDSAASPTVPSPDTTTRVPR